eukprot:359109-Chlamydomonas_euryale.AAC.2
MWTGQARWAWRAPRCGGLAARSSSDASYDDDDEEEEEHDAAQLEAEGASDYGGSEDAPPSDGSETKNLELSSEREDAALTDDGNVHDDGATAYSNCATFIKETAAGQG